MTGNKKTATRVGAQATVCGTKTTTIINRDYPDVNDIETWSPALDYWCEPLNDAEEEVER